MEQCSEDMNSVINMVLEMLGDWKKHIKINVGTGGGGVGVGIRELAVFEDKWEGKLNEVRLGFIGWLCLQEVGASGCRWSVWTLRKSTYYWDSFSGL